jgi:ABC-type lipoprotein release transport system permease subunit
MIVKTAWKNIWRNKTRSSVVITSIIIGVVGGLFLMAFMLGWVDQRLYTALNYETSHIQIVDPNFKKNNEIKYSFDPKEIVDNLSNRDSVTAVSGRLEVNAMVGYSAKKKGIRLLGVDPQKDSKVCAIYENIIPETGGIDKLSGKRKILIGKEFAEKMNLIHYVVNQTLIDSLLLLEVNSEIVDKISSLTGERYKNLKVFKSQIENLKEVDGFKDVEQLIYDLSRIYKLRTRLVLTLVDIHGEQVSEAYRIGGVFSINNGMYENLNAIININDLYRMTGIKNGDVHKLLIKLNDYEYAGEFANAIDSHLPNQKAEDWKQVQPDLAMISDMMIFFFNMFMVIILAAIAFGIINTMLMAVLERTKELGMLGAIGMSKKKVFKMIMLESLFLTLTGGVIGVVVGLVIVSITGTYGIDLSVYREGMEAMGFASFVYPKLPFELLINIALLIILTGILSAIYPALKALKLDPVEAIRTE